MLRRKIFEVCTGSLQSVINAVEGGAERIELCESLNVDGLTPSWNLFKNVRAQFPHLIVHILIRPRKGDFIYTEKEKVAILKDIRKAVEYGADGIVSGALLPDGSIDIPFLREMLSASQGIPFTFHRAFDVCNNPLQALTELMAEGVSRILTSGQQSTAAAGIPLLKKLVEKADGQLIIMPGGGVSSENVSTILKATGAMEIHGSAKTGEKETSADEVRSILKQL
jgi:copper homeostasis protein